MFFPMWVKKAWAFSRDATTDILYNQKKLNAGLESLKKTVYGLNMDEG